MASLAEIRALQVVQDDVNAVATKTYVDLLREFVGAPATQGVQSFFDVLFWDIITPAATQIDELAAQFYLEDREAQGLLTPPPPVPRLEVDERRVQSFAGWVRNLLDPGADPERTHFGFQEAVSKGSGGLQRQLFDRQRLMTLELGAAETDQTYYQRIARPGCCAFCAMLASRGAVYASLDAATKVVGRGVPIPRDANGDRIKKSGGQAGGIKTRGTRLPGESYHDQCVVPGTMVTGPPSHAGYRRMYEGKLITFITAMGHEVSVTPKHPVLTDSGWVPAGEINPGDQLVSSRRSDRSVIGGPDVDHVPARIEDVVGALSMVRAATRRRVPGAPEQFHGDGGNAEVDVVDVHHLLGDEGDTSVGEPFAELTLTGGPLQYPVSGLLCARHAALELPSSRSRGSADSFMGAGGESTPVLWGQLSHAERVRLGLAPLGQPRVSQPATHSRAADAVVLGQGQGAHALGVQTGQIGGRFESVARKFDPVSVEPLVERRGVYAQLGSDLLDRLATSVTFDRVVDVRVSDYHGEVLNLETSEGWYAANGLIVSNCRCLGVAQHGDNAQELDDLAAKWFEIYTAARDSAKAKFDYSSEQWATWDADGARAMHSRTFWVDDRKDSKTYGDELAYDAVQKQIVADMRRIAAESYDLVLA